MRPSACAEVDDELEFRGLATLCSTWSRRNRTGELWLSLLLFSHEVIRRSLAMPHVAYARP